MKNWIIFWLLITMVTFSCRKPNATFKNPKITEPEFKISWKSDSDLIIVKPVHSKTLNLTERNSWMGGIFSGSRDIASKYLILRTQDDLNRTRAKLFITIDSVPKSPRKGVDTFAPIVKKKDSILSPSPKIWYHSKTKLFNNVSLLGLSADELDLSLTQSINLNLNTGRYLNIDVTGNLTHGTTLPVPELYVNNFRQESKYIYFEYIGIGNISGIKTDYLTISSCNISQYSRIDCSDIKGIVLDNLRFSDSTSRLLLSVNKSKLNIQSNLIDRSAASKTWLWCSGDVNLNRLEFDYTCFTYVPDSNYLKSKTIFGDIIATQRKDDNQQGMVNAMIDSSKYEDEQHLISSFMIPLKSWWNNYGYDKTKVISSIIELFTCIWIINLFLFKNLLRSYKFTEIFERYQKLIWKSNKIGSSATYAVLCFIYSGYLFFGLKFEIDRLKLSSVIIALIIVIEYILGIISVAYLANLIISK